VSGEKSAFFYGDVPMRSNLIAGPAALAAVAVIGSSAGCAGGHHAQSGSASTAAESVQTKSAPAWSSATAMRRISGATVSVRGRTVRVDPGTLVCWGVGAHGRHGAIGVWRRFHCIAPTFHGAAAGPDLLFTVVSTGPATYRIEKPRFTSYGGD
jgi:hypothetical protein